MGGGASKKDDGTGRLRKIKALIDAGDLEGALEECGSVVQAIVANKKLAAISGPLGDLTEEAQHLTDELEKVHEEALEMLQDGETGMAEKHALRSAMHDSPDPDPAREHFAKALERYGQGMKAVSDRSRGWFAERQGDVSAAIPSFEKRHIAEQVHSSLQVKGWTVSVNKRGVVGAAFVGESYNDGTLICEFLLKGFKGKNDESDVFIGLVQEGVFGLGDFWYDGEYEDK
ncbi:hypothetical protein T484DRAFT_1813325, partial [Baffinella frigidus]